MAYRMTIISDQVRIGQRSSGDFHIEVFEVPGNEPEEIIVPRDDADEVARYILRHS